MGEASTSTFNTSFPPIASEHFGFKNPEGESSTHISQWERKKICYYVLESESTLNSDHDTESIHSIQAKETDIAKDTTDTDTYSSYESDSTREDVEYELATEVEDNEPALKYVSGNSSLDSDNDIITTKVISVALVDEGDLEADSEDSRAGSGADPELHLFDYWQCVGCRNPNNNPMFRYCEKCYKVRKNFFPPRPKPKKVNNVILGKVSLKRRTLSLEGGNYAKKAKINSVSRDSLSSDSASSDDNSRSAFSQPLLREPIAVQPLTKTMSDPLLTIENIAAHNRTNTEKESARARDIDSIPKKAVVNSLRENLANEESNLCITCLVEPKTGVFVHGRIAHICCCYKCAVKVWADVKRCPVCNQKVSNVLKAITL